MYSRIELSEVVPSESDFWGPLEVRVYRCVCGERYFDGEIDERLVCDRCFNLIRREQVVVRDRCYGEQLPERAIRTDYTSQQVRSKSKAVRGRVESYRARVDDYL